jgi:CBS domain-containing protein
MKLRDVLRDKGSHVYTIGPDHTVQDAVRVLMQHRIGALLVVDGEGAVVGIITERDVLRECQDRSEQLAALPVRAAMTRDVIVGLPDDDIRYTMGVMTQRRVRHLPVIDGGAIAGMISIGDMVKACLEETEYENRYLREYITCR